MKTNSLQDLSTLATPKTKVKVASFKPYLDRSITTWEPGTIDVDTFVTTVACKYIDTVDYNKCLVNNTLKHLYGKPINFADHITADLVCRVKEIMKETGKSIKEIAREFRDYLGYRCSFFRKEGHRQIPVDSTRIMNAYSAMKRRAPIKQIENILYGN